MKIGSKAKEEELQGKAKITKKLVKILINSNMGKAHVLDILPYPGRRGRSHGGRRSGL